MGCNAVIIIGRQSDTAGVDEKRTIGELNHVGSVAMSDQNDAGSDIPEAFRSRLACRTHKPAASDFIRCIGQIAVRPGVKTHDTIVQIKPHRQCAKSLALTLRQVVMGKPVGRPHGFG
jgi:hypothetical protein